MDTIDLINGVTLISSTQIDTFDSAKIFIFCILGVLSLAILGGCIYFGIKTGAIKFTGIFTIIALALASISFGFAANEMFVKNSPNRYKDQYVVTIDENVSMKEFYENYDIIKVEGEFYTIEEKME